MKHLKVFEEDHTEYNIEKLINAVKLDKLPLIQYMIEKDLVDPSAENNEALMIACEQGYYNIVKELLKDIRVDPSARNNQAIMYATTQNYVDIFDLLLQDSRVDPSDQNNYAIHTAASYSGNMFMIRQLLKDTRVLTKLKDIEFNELSMLIKQELIKKFDFLNNINDVKMFINVV